MWSHVVCLVLWNTCVTSAFLFDLEFGPPVDEAAKELGYPAERLEVTTSDGYKLGVFRILGTKNESVLPGLSTKPVVLCMHGIWLNAASWIFLREDSLPFSLADAGYDVWLGSSRGSLYSREHVSLSVDSSAFWDFSWEESGTHDLPAIVELIVKTTGKPQLQYVGHSMGSTEFLVLGSLRSELASTYVSHAYLLAPAGNLVHWGKVTRAVPVLRQLLHREIPFSRRLVRKFSVPLCTSKPFYRICRLVAYAIFGKSKSLSYNYDDTRMLFKEYGVDSGSYRQINHFHQNSDRPGKFRRYDFGRRNFDVYGSPEPPQFPVENISVPISAYYGTSDKAANMKDVQVLLSMLTSVRRVVKLPFAHLDFVLSRKGSDEFYPELIDNMLEDISPS